MILVSMDDCKRKGRKWGEKDNTYLTHLISDSHEVFLLHQKSVQIC